MQFYLAETVMFIKIWQLIILHIDRMDKRAGHLTTTVLEYFLFASTTFQLWYLPTKIAHRAMGRAFEKNSNARGMHGGLPGGMLVAGLART